MLIVGEKETKEQMLSVRQQGKGDIGKFSIEGFSSLIKEIIEKDFIDYK